VRALRGTSDTTLLELDDPVDPSFEVSFAGWDNRSANPASAVVIHHPGDSTGIGREKVISFEDDSLTSSSNNNMLYVDAFDRGDMEPGSSGAPLFDPAHRVVGQLYGCVNHVPCNNPNPAPCWFGKLSFAWDGPSSSERLRDWLDPDDTGVFWLDGVVDPEEPPEPIHESGVLGDEIDRLKGLAFQRQSGLYVVPTSAELEAFGSLADRVEAGELDQAAAEAFNLGYEVVLFTDTDDGREYYLLRERLEGGQQRLGWGSYLYDPLGSDLLVEVPHPLFETNTPQLGTEVFKGTRAMGFLMAGAHRNAQGDGNSGQANPTTHTDCVFHVVHEEWSAATTLPMQIHGFDLDKHASFPAGTDIVLSNGDGAVWTAHVKLDEALDAAGLLSFVYNTLPVADQVNQQVNADWENGGVADGTSFSSLADTLNVQGQYTRDTYGQAFLPVELEQSVRFNDPRLWQPAVDALVAVVGGGPPDPDEEAPICNSTGSGSDRIVITVQDELSGLAEIRVGRSRNVDVDVPNFKPGTTEPVQVTALIENQARTATVALKNTDEAGNGSTCKSVKRPPRRTRRRSR